MFCDGKLVQADAKPLNLTEAINNAASEEEGCYPNKSFTAEWNATISNDKSLEELRKLLAKPSRKFTRGERKLFIRTVEHHGKVEFTLHDWKGMVEGVFVPHIILVCNTPRQVRLLLRMKNLGKVSYKIRKKYDTGSNRKDCRNAAHD